MCSVTALKPLTGKINIDHLITMQRSAGKPHFAVTLTLTTNLNIV